jgi:ribosomal protein L34
MTEELIQKTRNWLDTQGYPLEMKVARCFQKVGFRVSSSEYYLDPDERKPREIDVIASMDIIVSGKTFQFAFTVECKSSKGSPWVCLQGSSKQQRDSSIGFLARQSTIQGHDLLTEVSCNPDITTNRLFGLPERYAYGVTNALKNKIDLPYQAIVGAQKAAKALISHYDKTQTLPNPVHTVCIAFPLVVVETPIFNCTLADDGTIELAEVPSHTILRTGFDTYYSIVEIVAASSLEKFIDSKAELMSNFLRRLPSRIPGTLEQLDIIDMTSESD